MLSQHHHPPQSKKVNGSIRNIGPKCPKCPKWSEEEGQWSNQERSVEWQFIACGVGTRFYRVRC